MVLGQRLAELRKRAGMAQVELAVAMGDRYNQQMISHVENGRAAVRIDGLVRCAEALDVSTDYLLGLTDDPTPATDLLEQVKRLERALIEGELLRGPNAEQYAAMRRDLFPLAQTLEFPPEGTVIYVRGESMEPTLTAGDSVLVDSGRTQRQEGHIFAAKINGDLVIGRASVSEAGAWELVGDNPAWGPVPWPDNSLIVGEVRWAARTF